LFFSALLTIKNGSHSFFFFRSLFIKRLA
jgi:hypothetical protein